MRSVLLRKAFFLLVFKFAGMLLPFLVACFSFEFSVLIGSFCCLHSL